MAPVIAVQRIGAATPRRVNRPAMRGIGLAAAVVAKVDRQVAGRRHGQHDDLRDQRASRERQLDVENVQQRLGRQPDRPARDHGHDRPPDAVHGRERHQRDQDHAHDRQPSAVHLDGREAIGQKHGRSNHRRPAQPVPLREPIGHGAQRLDRLDHVVLLRLPQPDHDGRGRARLVDQRAPK